MPDALLFLVTSLVIFIVIAEIPDIRIIYNDTLTVRIDFIILAVEFFSTPTTINKPKHRSQKRNVPTFANIRQLLFSLLKKSEIDIYEFIIYKKSSSPFYDAIIWGVFVSFFSSLLNFTIQNAKKISYENIIIDSNEHNNSSIVFDVRIRIALLNIIIALIPFSARCVKDKILRLKDAKKYG